MMTNILLIEDDQLLRTLYAHMLESCGHQVTQAANGRAGLQLFDALSGVDLVVTDILMPLMDGIELIHEVRLRQPKLPIIAISGGHHTVSAEFKLQQAVRAGATLELKKPFSHEDLEGAIQQLLASGAQAEASV